MHPVNLVNKLARDNSIAVAGPVLTHSDRLDTPSLVSIAAVWSQQHLLAISKRRSIAELVTDVLVTRGNRDVLHSLSGNPGARFSDRGFLQLIQRSENDFILLESVGIRKDIPRAIFQQLIAKASQELKRKTRARAARHGGRYSNARLGYYWRSPLDIRTRIKELLSGKESRLHAPYRMEILHEKAIFEYAQARQFPEVIAGLSLLCALPANAVERGLADPTGETPLIFAKFLGFSWQTTMSLLFLGAEGHKIPARKFEELEAKFSRLKAETAQSVIQLYQSRKARRE